MLAEIPGWAIWLLTASAGMAVLLVGLRKLAPRLGLLDVPTERKRHFGAVPVVGGVSLWLVLTSFAVVGWTLGNPFFSAECWFVLTLLFGIGLCDDVVRSGLGAGAKTGLTLLVLWLAVGESTAILWLLPAFLVLHAWNTFDNLNGLASGSGLASVLMLLVHSFGVVAVPPWTVSATAVFAGGLAVFFVLNYPRGRVFLGDSGSLMLGGWFALILLNTRDPTLLCLTALPLADLVTVAWRRIRSGQRPWVGDWNHVSHRLAARLGARASALVLVVLQCLFSGLAFWMLATPMSLKLRWGLALLLIAVAGGICAAVRRPHASVPAVSSRSLWKAQRCGGQELS